MTIAAAVMVAVIPGMTPVGEPPILGIAAFALFMALINASIKPIVHLVSLPFAILSLGLVTLIINWLGSLVLTIVSSIVGAIIDQ